MEIRKLPGCVWVLSAAIASGRCASGQITASIHTNQTFLELRAGSRNPQLVTLGTGMAAADRKPGWRNVAAEKLIGSVSVGGQSVAVRWKLNRKDSSADGRRVAFIYDSVHPRLRLVWEWTARAANGPLEHSIHIENLEDSEVWIPLQDSFQFELPTDPAASLEHLYVEKGAGAPSAVGTHLARLPVGYRWNGTSSTYAHPAKNEPREVIPFLAVENAVENTDGPRLGWYAGIEFSGRTRLTIERNAQSLRGAVGLNPDPGPFRSRLKPHEVFHTPTVFVGAFAGDADALGNVLRPWVRDVLGNPRTWRNPHFPLLVNNSWGSGMRIDEALARRMLRDSAELGLEMFHIDAGWFRDVGDWRPDPKKFPHGLRAIADDAHRLGLKFGIWADWTQAALSSARGALNLRDPQVRDWTTFEVPADWKPQEFKGETIDIGVPEAHAYAKAEVFRMVEDYGLDMLEHDGYLVAQGCARNKHPHAPPDPSRISITKDEGSSFVESSNSTDVSYHAVRAYYDIHAELRRRHPEVLLEVCNDGGRMVDFGSAAHADYFSITDSYNPLANRRAFYDASHLLPAAMLEAYVEKWPAPKIENFRYMLRSGMMGWLTIMLDTNAWTAEQHAAAKQEIQLYKRELRAFIRDADIYRIAPRPDGIHWDGMEFFDGGRGKGVVYAFRGSGEKENEHAFRVKGLDPAKDYRLRFQDRTAPDRVVNGRDLQTSGLLVNLPVPNSSELIFLAESAP